MHSLFLVSFLLSLAWVLALPDSDSDVDLSATTPSGNATSEEPEIPTNFSPFAFRDGRFAVSAFAKVNWFQAQATCASYGYTLVSLNMEQDQRALRTFLFTFARNQQDLLYDPLWTSGTDLPNANSWVWFSNGRALNYRNFQNGLPGYSSDNRNCLAIDGISGTWINANCRDQRYFICEKRCLFDDDVN
ncbi:hypothetical protein KR074_007338 [Drosophila pseudoananassae]|nr:hypothetical protein KR074_007338 [Drosophila pseudoananassae]